jgi:hypothetical protein
VKFCEEKLLVGLTYSSSVKLFATCLDGYTGKKIDVCLESMFGQYKFAFIHKQVSDFDGNL